MKQQEVTKKGRKEWRTWKERTREARDIVTEYQQTPSEVEGEDQAMGEAEKKFHDAEPKEKVLEIQVDSTQMTPNQSAQTGIPETTMMQL